MANRFAGLMPDRHAAVLLQLLCNILTALGMSSCNLDTLTASAVSNRFAGLMPDRHDAVLLQLLCEIVSAGGGGSAAQIKDYVADPNVEGVTPGNQALPAIAYAAGGAGPTYTWNTGTLLWQ